MTFEGLAEAPITVPGLAELFADVLRYYWPTLLVTVAASFVPEAVAVSATRPSSPIATLPLLTWALQVNRDLWDAWSTPYP